MSKSRTIAIGDIHGCLCSLETLLNKQLQPEKEDHLIFLGDYIDRGPSSKQVLDLLMEMQASGQKMTCLTGNHELMFLNARSSEEYHVETHWVKNGGDATLASFMAFQPKSKYIDEKYIDWMKDLPFYCQTDEAYFVHAGLNMQIENPFEDLHSMAWIRSWYGGKMPDKLVVHGHTPLPKDGIIASNARKRNIGALNLDGGCCYADRHPGMGYLCAWDATNDLLYMQENVEVI